MLSFIRKTIFFLLPIISLLLSLELAVRYSENTFKSKSKFILSNPDIELLILGSSHNQGIKDESFSLKSANLAVYMQDLQLDSALFFSQIKNLKSLKYIILEFDYITLFKKNPEDYFRYSWYYIYYNINLNDLEGIDKYSLYKSSPVFFNDILIKKFKYQDGLHINKFEKMKYDDEKIEIETRKRFVNIKKVLSKKNFEFNSNKLNSIVEYCEKNKIQVILLSNPMYKAYIKNYDPKLNRIRLNYLNDLKSKYSSIIHFNYEKQTIFNVKDFTDEDHLNQNALIKYTQLINVRLDSLEQLNSLH